MVADMEVDAAVEGFTAEDFATGELRLEQVLLSDMHLEVITEPDTMQSLLHPTDRVVMRSAPRFMINMVTRFWTRRGMKSRIVSAGDSEGDTHDPPVARDPSQAV